MSLLQVTPSPQLGQYFEPQLRTCIVQGSLYKHFYNYRTFTEDVPVPVEYQPGSENRPVSEDVEFSTSRLMEN